MTVTIPNKSLLLKKITVALIMVAISLAIIFISKYTSVFDFGSTAYSNEAITKDGFFFDTYISISIYDSKDNYSADVSSTEDIASLLTTCMEMCEDYENVFSRTLDTSEIYTINNNPDFINGIEIPLSDTLADCITQTLEYASVFGKKYSIISGALCDIWDFNKAKIPSAEEIAYNCIGINSYKLIVKNNSLKLNFDNNEFIHNASNWGYTIIDESTTIPIPNSELNLGASAKGYIADKLCQYLKDNGIHDAIIDLGGNIVVIGDKFDDSMYNIGIKKPFSNTNEPYAVCKVADMSVVTSGIYERYFETDNQIYHHIIDCSTGYPADNDILSVTIITANSLMADCYSTGCLLLGRDNALTLINNTEEVECIIIDDNYNIHLSNGLTYNDGHIVIK